MVAILFMVVLSAEALFFVNSALIGLNNGIEIHMVQSKIKLIRERLKREGCVNFNSSLEPATSKLASLESHFTNLTDQLIHCRKINEVYCQSATNFSQPLRASSYEAEPFLDMKYYLCDLRDDIEWFRFTEGAGTRLRDTCPFTNSCGTSNPYWSDESAPAKDGELKTITAYISFRSSSNSEGGCKNRPTELDVLRCSPTDIIYRYKGKKSQNCATAFCSMG